MAAVSRTALRSFDCSRPEYRSVVATFACPSMSRTSRMSHGRERYPAASHVPHVCRKSCQRTLRLMPAAFRHSSHPRGAARCGSGAPLFVQNTCSGCGRFNVARCASHASRAAAACGSSGTTRVYPLFVARPSRLPCSTLTHRIPSSSMMSTRRSDHCSPCRNPV